MNYLRAALYFLVVVVFCLLGLGLYCYQNLPSLLERQAKIMLAEYGVSDVSVEGLAFSKSQFSATLLRLQGEHQGISFDAVFHALTLDYNWRALIDGKVNDIHLDRAALLLSGAPATSDLSTGPVTITDLLPMRRLVELSLPAIEIKQWQLDYAYPEREPLSASGSLRLSDQLQMSLASHYLGCDLSAHITDDAKAGAAQRNEATENVVANIQLSEVGAELLSLNLHLANSENEIWQWRLDGAAQFKQSEGCLRRLNDQLRSFLGDATRNTTGNASTDGWLDDIELLAESKFTALITHPQTFDFSSVTDSSSLSQLSAELHIINSIENLNLTGVVEELSGVVDLSLLLNQGETSLTLAPSGIQGKIASQQLALSPQSLEWLGWPQSVAVNWTNVEPINLKIDQNSGWRLTLNNTKLKVGNKKSEVILEQLTVNHAVPPVSDSALIKLQPVRAVVTQLSARVQTRLQNRSLPSMKLSINHSGALSQSAGKYSQEVTLQSVLEKSTFTLSLNDIAESFMLKLQGYGNLNSGRGKFTISARTLDLPYASKTLLPLMKKFDLLVQIPEFSSGVIALNSQIQSQNFDWLSWQQQADLRIENLSGRYGEYPFEGLAVKAKWNGVEQWQTQQPVELTLKKLNVGFDITDLTAQLALPKKTAITKPKLNIQQLSATMFGGQVDLLEPTQWDFSADSNKFILRARQWQLADIVALQKGQEIEAVGVMEGVLPVIVAGGRLIIEQGGLHALRPGGNIRYIADADTRALAASSPELATAMDLLSDFEYEVLSSKVQLDEKGNLVLALSVGGKNPKKYGGRRINFNINLEQNLDPLLQSLRLSDKLVEELEGRLR